MNNSRDVFYWNGLDTVTTEKVLSCLSGQCSEKLFPCQMNVLEAKRRGCHSIRSKDQMTIYCMPPEILAICWSYTGECILNARLTCRRFNEIIEEHQNKMNVIPIDTLDIREGQSPDVFTIEQSMGYLSNSPKKEIICNLEKIMFYLRFLRPKRLIGRHLETMELKENNLPLLSIFPNVNKLEFRYSETSVVTSLVLAQISAHPSLICRFVWCSGNKNFSVENDLLLDVLSAKSNKFDDGMVYLDYTHVCSMDAIIRFLENTKFAKLFETVFYLEDYFESVIDPVRKKLYLAENCGYRKLRNWLYSKGLGQREKNARIPSTEWNFVYRSTNFNIICR